MIRRTHLKNMLYHSMTFGSPHMSDAYEKCTITGIYRDTERLSEHEGKTVAVLKYNQETGELISSDFEERQKESKLEKKE